MKIESIQKKDYRSDWGFEFKILINIDQSYNPTYHVYLAGDGSNCK